MQRGCFEREAQLQPLPPDGSPAEMRKIGAENDENLLGHRHHLVVQALWEDVADGLPEPAELPAFQLMLEVLIESVCSVSRLEEHPALLNLYHLAALSTQEDLEVQKHYLFFSVSIQRRHNDRMTSAMHPWNPQKLGLS